MKITILFIFISFFMFFNNSIAFAGLTNPIYIQAMDAYSQGKWLSALTLLQRYKIDDAKYLNDHPKILSNVNDYIEICKSLSYSIKTFSAHGTLNLVLSSDNCTVIASDSRLTFQNISGVKYQDNFIKVFNITDDIVVTVAGYYYVGANGPAELSNSIAAIIKNYVSEIQSDQYKPTYQEAIAVLNNTIVHYLDTLTSINSPKSEYDIKHYESQLMFSGIDDGKFKVTKSILKYKQDKNGQFNYGVDTVENMLSFEGMSYQLAGWSSIANDIIVHPERYSKTTDKGITQYLALVQNHKSSSMSCDQLQELSESIINFSGTTFHGIGGPIHTAIFKNNRFQLNIHHNARPLMIGAPIKYALRRGNIYEAGGHIPIVDSASIAVNVDNIYLGPEIFIDNNYYIRSKFKDCIIRVNSDNFYFHNDNILLDCVVILEPDIKLNPPSSNIRELLTHFKRQNIYKRQYYCNLPEPLYKK